MIHVKTEYYIENHSNYHPTCHESKPGPFEAHQRVPIFALILDTMPHNTAHAVI
jgi:hypothetical protein